MGSYEIVGGRKLDGKLKIESAKNAVLPMLAGSILTREKVCIQNCPKISDVISMINILRSIGVKADFINDCLVIDSSNLNDYKIPENLSKKLRSSIYMLGALISRCKKAVLSQPGGCKIGLRPIDIHIEGLKKLGVIAHIEEKIVCRAEKLQGANIKLRFPSVGATINIILASVLCEGVTIITNSAQEPEIIDFINFLNSMGANIENKGKKIIIIGVKKLHGTVYKPIPDRIEEATFLVALQMLGGKLEISGGNAYNIKLLLDKFLNNTCKSKVYNDIIYINCENNRMPISFRTAPYPGFATDMQPQFMVYNSVADGISVIEEEVFENRFIHVSELIKMGADIRLNSCSATIKGVLKLHGAMVDAMDLRGGASLVLAGLVAEGKTIINDIHHIERGYLDFHLKLSSLGAEIKKI